MEGKAPILETFDYEIQDRFYGVLVGLAKRIMKNMYSLNEWSQR
jgi:hypothetical protein